MLLVALTGGIGSGKSTATTFFAQCGAVVIEADKLAKEVLATGTPGLAAVKAHFGSKVLQRDKSLDRAALAQIIFADPVERAVLEGIVHPLVHRLFGERIASLPEDSVVIYEIPLLVEVGKAEDFQLVITVETPLSTRIERLAKRGLSQEEAMSRISEQSSNSERRAVADIVLTNSTSEMNFISNLLAVWNLRLKPFAENIAANRSAEIGEVDPASIPNLLPLSSQVSRIMDRIEHAINGKIEVVSLAEVVVATGQAKLSSKLKHLGFVEVEPDRSYASADPGRPMNLQIIKK